MRPLPRVVLLASLGLAVGCHRAIAPKLSYTLPPAALLPVEAGGIRDASDEFGSAFCSVFEGFEVNYKYGCDHYLPHSSPKQMHAAASLASDQDLADFRFILVSGFATGCLEGSQFAVFGDADAPLRRHRVVLERIPLRGMQSAEEDARQIVTWLSTPASLADQRRLVFVGYSKGAADFQAAILQIQSESPVLYSRVAALITVAGLIGGTRLYDQVDRPEQFASLLSHFPLFHCPAGERNFRSLSRQERQAFLRLHWKELERVPTYSLTTVSTPADTSRALQPLWQRLSVYGTEEDGQLAQPEQIAPGATYLGAARADHWAIALPLERDRALRLLVDRNHFPRAATLEALLRYVVADLKSPARAASVPGG